ncbi:MAG: LptF/LptG family permease [Candidatus Omnitrophica bacterium]|nr:LptF/LptG family permease [Candidatus Omnitrophota bacterium]
MRILDRYILKSIITIFVGMVVTFAFLFILIDTFGNLQDFIEKKVSLQIITQYYVSFLPMIIVNTSTMACLMATLFTYSNLNHHNEIVAIRASGMNFWQVTKPAFIFTLIVSAGVLLINERFVPQSSLINQEIREAQIKVAVAEKSHGLPIIKNFTLYGLKNRLFFIDTFDPNTNILNGISIISHDRNQNLTEKIVASKGIWTGIVWKFLNCQITTYGSALPNIPGEIKVYPEKLMDIKETPKDFLRQRLDVTAMNIRQLSEYIGRFSGSGAVKTINNLKVDLFEKIALPLRNIVIILAGLPFVLISSSKRKAATFASIGVALIIGFLYYVIDAVGLALGKGGALPPWACAFVAPSTFLVIGLAAIKLRF